MNNLKKTQKITESSSVIIADNRTIEINSMYKVLVTDTGSPNLIVQSSTKEISKNHMSLRLESFEEIGEFFLFIVMIIGGASSVRSHPVEYEPAYDLSARSRTSSISSDGDYRTNTISLSSSKFNGLTMADMDGKYGESRVTTIVNQDTNKILEEYHRNENLRIPEIENYNHQLTRVDWSGLGVTSLAFSSLVGMVSSDNYNYPPTTTIITYFFLKKFC